MKVSHISIPRSIKSNPPQANFFGELKLYSEAYAVQCT